MKKPKLNIQSQMTQKLIHLLSDLENVDRQRMSSSGKHYLDEIWRLLRQPTYAEIKAKQEKPVPELFKGTKKQLDDLSILDKEHKEEE